MRYHKFEKSFRFYVFKIKLLFIKYFSGKIINIIILPEHIGDVIAFTPFAQKLKIENKNNYIVWLIKASYLPIIQYNENIDWCLPIFCDGFVEKIKLDAGFTIFDVRFNGNNHCPICDSKRVFGKIDQNFNLKNYYEYGSLLEIFSQLAGKPMQKAEWKPIITISQITENEIDKLNLQDKYITIHTSSNDPDREWLLDKWEQLIDYLIGKNYKIIQIGLENKLQAIHPNFIDLTGQLTLLQTAQVIKKSEIFIGIDSGPAHIANAMATKSIILLGKYREIVNYMPFSGNFAVGINAKIIYDSNTLCNEISVEKVISEIDNLI